MSAAEKRSLQTPSSSVARSRACSCRGQITPVDFAAYARALSAYAGSRLDPASLHAWMIQRLMTDKGLEHAEALLLTDNVLNEARHKAHNEPRVARRLLMTGN